MKNNNVIINVLDFNSIAKQPDLIKKLRKLTLNRYSGMNYELTSLNKMAKKRKVNCRIIVASINDEMVGWALLSREPSDFIFPTGQYYEPICGFLFQIFTNLNHRKKGIATEIIKIARRLSGPYKLCVCPWNYSSDKFYEKFKYKFKIL